MKLVWKASPACEASSEEISIWVDSILKRTSPAITIKLKQVTAITFEKRAVKLQKVTGSVSLGTSYK